MIADLLKVFYTDKSNVVYKLCFLSFTSQSYFPNLDYQASNWIKGTLPLEENCWKLAFTTQQQCVLQRSQLEQMSLHKTNMAGEPTYQHGTPILST